MAMDDRKQRVLEAIVALILVTGIGKVLLHVNAGISRRTEQGRA